MKSKYAVILTWILLCCIPAVVYFAFRDSSEDNEYTRAIPETQWPITKQEGNYQIDIEPLNTPLKRGEQALKLTIQRTSQQALPLGLPQVAIRMPMGRESIMSPPVSIARLPQAGQYKVQTEFSMAGDWELQVKPEATTQPIKLNFDVQL